MKRRRFFLTTTTALALATGGALAAQKTTPLPVQAAPAAVTAVKDVDAPLSVVRVEVTDQPWDFIHPWAKKAPITRSGIGAVLSEGRVLVTGSLVADADYVELIRAETGERIAATVDVVDYDANLAILKPADAAFLKALKPLELTDSKVGDRVDVVQLEATGAQVATEALLTTVTVAPYPISDAELLVYRLSSSLQYRDASYTLPVLRDGKLTGLLIRYDSRSQTVETVSAPVLRHFLTAAAKKPYAGFPRAGLSFEAMRDPQLRHYAGVKDDSQPGGVYITAVNENSSAEKAGLKAGDVLLSVDGQEVDADGNYRDKTYGKLALQNIISTKHFDGDKVPVSILRDGKPMALTVQVGCRPLSDYAIEPYSFDHAPRFYVLGGLVLQELSRQYLKEWGPSWEKKAPEKFVYLDRYQDSLFHDGQKRVVFLSQVLPTPLTIGDDQIGGVVVTKVNDQPINRISDLPAALEHPVNGFYKIEFDSSPYVLYLDAAQTKAIEPVLMRTYGLPAIKQLD